MPKLFDIPTNRIEAFSDGVISILITIMVFDIKIPIIGKSYSAHEIWRVLGDVGPKFIAFLLSFIVLGIMWVNHHHIYHMTQKVDEKLLYLNMNLLFWMCLIPFPTDMIGEHPMLPESSVLYGGVMFMVSFAFIIMRNYVNKHHLMEQKQAKVNQMIRVINHKGILKNLGGVICYALAIPLAYVSVYASFVCFLIPPFLYLIPEMVKEEDIVSGDSIKPNIRKEP